MTLDRNLAHLDPKMKTAVLLLLNHLKFEGIPVFLNEGYRSNARQAELYAQGRTTTGARVTNAKPGYGRHNFGQAIDLYPCDKDGDPLFNFDPAQHKWPRVVALAKMCGLAWGGDWRTFRDFPHMELKAALPLWVLRLRYPRGWTPPKGSK